MRRVMMAGFLVLVGTGTACLGTSTVDSSKVASAAVTGQITKAGGVGVAGSIVSIQLTGPVVNGSAPLLSQLTLTTDSEGRYLFLFILTGQDPGIGGATLAVTPPIGSGLAPRDTTDIPVTLVQGQSPTDTSYVNIELNPR